MEFSGLSTADQRSVQAFCTRHNATQSQALCSTAARLGTCVIPSEGPGSGVTCSPHGAIAIRYFAPYTAASAQTACGSVSGSVWTPG